MYHNNKKIGNDFERKLIDILREYDFFIYHTPNKIEGQPCDFIIAKNNQVAFLDSKHCQEKEFPFTDIRENQELAFKFNFNKRNYECGFAIYFSLFKEWFYLSYSKYTELLKINEKRANALNLEPLRDYLNRICK